MVPICKYTIKINKTKLIKINKNKIFTIYFLVKMKIFNKRAYITE